MEHNWWNDTCTGCGYTFKDRSGTIKRKIYFQSIIHGRTHGTPFWGHRYVPLRFGRVGVGERGGGGGGCGTKCHSVS